MTLFIGVMLVLMLVATVVAIYVEWRAHREVMAARRAPGAVAMLALARQVEDLEERLGRVERNRRVVPQ